MMLLIPIFAAAFFILIIVYYVKKYQKTSYYKTTKHSYFSVLNNSGRYGEYLLYKRLEKLEKSGAKFLFNLYIPKANGETTELDMIMISSKGIFVFESKNYSGWIFGSENQKNWYQTLPTGKGRSHKESFYNPIMQNKTHVAALDEFIEEAIPIYSVIVFSDKCVFKDVHVESTDVALIYLSQAKQVVSDVLNEDDGVLLSEDCIEEIYNKLYLCSQVSEEEKNQHIQTIRDKKSASKSEYFDDFQSLKCPKCGGSLVLRTTKKGENVGNQFYGCSNYPKCKYTKNVK